MRNTYFLYDIYGKARIGSHSWIAESSTGAGF
jgi:hypothetical protein